MMRDDAATRRPILVVQHAENEGLGLLASALEGLKIETLVARPDRGDTVPRSAVETRGVILLGGPMGVYESDRYPHLKDEVALASDALAHGVPILGLCLGSQILAAAAGARVFRGPEKEIGWLPVNLTAEGRRDPVLGLLPEGAVVFHWHGDTFDLPRGAALLASSRLYPHQAFHLGPRAYAVQFHPEITPEMVDLWVERAGRDSDTVGGRDGGALMSSEARRHASSCSRLVGELVLRLFGDRR